MVGSEPVTELIEPSEALRLHRFTTVSEMHIAYSLYNAFKEQEKKESDRLWALMDLCSFIYNTGRVQGIREERKRRVKENAK